MVSAEVIDVGILFQHANTLVAILAMIWWSDASLPRKASLTEEVEKDITKGFEIVSSRLFLALKIWQLKKGLISTAA
jgi:hypothetical protein